MTLRFISWKGTHIIWWLALDKRTNGNLRSFADFEIEFNRKYFPALSWDRLESKFLDLVKGRMTLQRSSTGSGDLWEGC